MECAVVCPVQIYFYTSLNLFTCLFIDESDDCEITIANKGKSPPVMWPQSGVPFSSPSGRVGPVSRVVTGELLLLQKVFSHKRPTGESRKGEAASGGPPYLTTDSLAWTAQLPFPHLRFFGEQEVIQSPFWCPRPNSPLPTFSGLLLIPTLSSPTLCYLGSLSR